MLQINTHTNVEENFIELFRQDFQNKTDSYKLICTAKKKFLQLSGLSEKTWYRYSKNETIPCGHNIIRSYKFILDLENDDEVIGQLPQQALEYYKKTVDVADLKSKRAKLSTILNTSHVHTRLFLETLDGTYVNKMDFIESWGKNLALRAFKDLEDHKIITHLEGNFYKRGQLNSTFEASELLHFSRALINSELDEKQLQNGDAGTFLAFDSFQLSEESIHEYRELCMRHREELYNFAKENKGSSKVITSFASLKIQRENMQ